MVLTLSHFLRDCSGAVDPLERLLVETVVIHCKTSFTQTVLSVKVVQFGNLLPDYLKSIANYNHLKKAMKYWLIHQQTCSHV